MDDKEKIQSFGDMVNATQKLSEPWQKSSFHMKILLGVTNLLWAIVVFALIWFAYMTPIDSSQTQNLPDGSQTQSYTQGVTDGK